MIAMPNNVARIDLTTSPVRAVPKPRGMALNRIQHIKPVIRALNALHRETYAEVSALLVAGFMYLLVAKLHH